jgi:hypothetical protein
MADNNTSSKPDKEYAAKPTPTPAARRTKTAAVQTTAVPRYRTWEEKLHLVQKFIRGNRRLPRTNGGDRDELERTLGTWLATQRDARTQHDEHRRELLEALPGFEWEPREAHWDDRMKDYRLFRSQQRREPSRGSEDPFERSLALWAARQRAARRRGTLPFHRAAELNGLDRL